MKSLYRIVSALFLVLAGLGTAHADRGHVRFSVVVDPYWGAPPYYYAPYYPPPVVVERVAPPVYVEQARVPAQNYWYYCSDAQAYYPYVKQCPGGWQQVVPQPPEHP